MRHLKILAAAAVPMSVPAASATTVIAPPGVAAFVRDHRPAVYTVALADLNGDDRPEVLIYAMATEQGGGRADLCGSGGCDFYVLSRTATGYRRVTTIPIVRPPIRVLPTTTHGWHDIGVMVSGGGIATAYEARLRFDGRSYPRNPTVPPAMQLKATIGRQVIGTDAGHMPEPGTGG